jgi:hypothetical protein
MGAYVITIERDKKKKLKNLLNTSNKNTSNYITITKDKELLS